MANQTGKHIIFSGRVQGVGFRFTAMNKAKKYDLSGFVRNQADGTVEMTAQGNPDDINHCIEEIKDYFSGNIRNAQITEVPLNPNYNDFKITF